MLSQRLCALEEPRGEGAAAGDKKTQAFEALKALKITEMTSRTTRKYECYLFLSLNKGESHGLKCRLRLSLTRPRRPEMDDVLPSGSNIS